MNFWIKFICRKLINIFKIVLFLFAVLIADYILLYLFLQQFYFFYFIVLFFLGFLVYLFFCAKSFLIYIFYNMVLTAGVFLFWYFDESIFEIYLFCDLERFYVSFEGMVGVFLNILHFIFFLFVWYYKTLKEVDI